MSGMINYATFSYKGAKVGIAVWCSEHKWHTIKFFKIGYEECDAYASIVEENLESWILNKRLPHLKEELYPYQDGWWLHVRKLLNHEVKLSDIKTL